MQRDRCCWRLESLLGNAASRRNNVSCLNRSKNGVLLLPPQAQNQLHFADRMSHAGGDFGGLHAVVGERVDFFFFRLGRTVFGVGDARGTQRFGLAAGQIARDRCPACPSRRLREIAEWISRSRMGEAPAEPWKRGKRASIYSARREPRPPGRMRHSENFAARLPIGRPRGRLRPSRLARPAFCCPIRP